MSDLSNLSCVLSSSCFDDDGFLDGCLNCFVEDCKASHVNLSYIECLTLFCEFVSELSNNH